METRTLHERLFAVQKDLPVLPKSKEGYGYMYTPLDVVMEALRPLLNREGLVITHDTAMLEGKLHLLTTLCCAESGERCGTTVPLYAGSGKNPMQELGAAITYARRYALSMLFALVNDEDTDGSLEKRLKAACQKAGPRIEAWQVEELEKVFCGNAELRDDFLIMLRDQRGWSDFVDIPQSLYRNILEYCKSFVSGQA